MKKRQYYQCARTDKLMTEKNVNIQIRRNLRLAMGICVRLVNLNKDRKIAVRPSGNDCFISAIGFCIFRCSADQLSNVLIHPWP